MQDSIAMRHPTLIGSLWQQSGGTEAQKVLRYVVLAVAGSMLLWLSAKIKVPLFAVDITMQTFAVLVIGAAFGARLGAATVVLYLAQGAAGLPVFTDTPEKGLGFAYMMGPTGGYLVGFVLAAYVTGWLAERGWDRNVMLTALAMLAGNVLIYVPGLLWLGSLFGWDKPILEWGLFPFIYSDLAKLALAAVALPLGWRLLNAK